MITVDAIVVDFDGREGEPFVLYGFIGRRDRGSIGIVNAPPGDMHLLGVPLWRFRKRDQADAAAAVIGEHARLDPDGACHFVPEARAAALPDAQRRAFFAWARRVSPLIERTIAERRLGPGAYSLIDQARGSFIA